jgi:hypothetical protein
MAKRHDDALFIQTGACNPIGIAKALESACLEAHEEDAKLGDKRIGTMAVRRDPAVRLITHQLCHLLGMNVDEQSGTSPASFVYHVEYAACLIAASEDTITSLRLFDEREGVRRHLNQKAAEPA